MNQSERLLKENLSLTNSSNKLLLNIKAKRDLLPINSHQWQILNNIMEDHFNDER